MSDAVIDPALTIRPVSEPTCCPDAYLCLAGGRFEIECPHHSGFDVCCDQPDRHIQQERAIWHKEMDLWEQELLNRHIQRFKIMQAYGYEDTEHFRTLLSREI